ncbi:VC0807 family protein [Streptantibioticus parmotrematis]|uniref:VC0807 family protein n=1 Tax=Streptantibioticus parmotrematis TaxID=2873249 RepID=UPI0033FEB872
MTNPATAGGPARPDPSPSSQLVTALRPLVIDVAVPTALYYVLHDAAKLSSVDSLILSGVVPMIRTVFGLIRERKVNGLALLMLVVTVAGAGISAMTGSARLMLAKESLGTGVIGLSIAWSAFTRQPLMTNAMRPMMTKGEAEKEAAWEHLRATSPAFRRGISNVSLLWGLGLLGDCVLRVIGAYTLPVDTMVWMSTVILVGAVLVLMVGTGKVSDRAERLLLAHVEENARRDAGPGCDGGPGVHAHPVLPRPSRHQDGAAA